MLTVVDHPVLKRDLSILRDRETPHAVFRSTLMRASTVLIYEASRHLPLRERELSTPLEMTRGHLIDSPVHVISILRAGLGMIEGTLALFPEARQGHIGLFRDEATLQPVFYYKNFPPDIERAHVFLVDPMLATGGSAIEAINQLKAEGTAHCTFVCLIAAQEGVDALRNAHPEIRVVTAALDRELDQNAFIRPGLGDAGNRTFGT